MRKCLATAFLAGLVAFVVPRATAAQDWRTITSLRQVNGEDLLRVDVEYGAGTFEVAPAGTNELYRVHLRYDADVFQPVLTYRGDRLKVALQGGNIHGRNLKSGRLNLQLSRDVPLEMELKFGAVEASLDLGGLRIHEAKISTGASTTAVHFSQPNPDECRSLDLEVGAAKFRVVGLGNLNTARLNLSGGVGEVLLDFTGQWRADMAADISMGFGTLTLRVPRDLGVQVRKGGLLASFDSQGLVKRGDVYQSENWARADHHLTVNLDAALGSIRVVWVDGLANNTASAGGQP